MKLKFRAITLSPKSIFFKLKLKNKLLTRLILSFSIIIIISQLLSIGVTFFITKNKVTSDFKASTTQILNQNKNYVHLINANIENVSTQILTNKTLIDLLNHKAADAYDLFTTKTNIADILSNITMGNTSNIIKDIYLIDNDGYSSTTAGSSDLSDENIKKVQNEDWYKSVQALNGAFTWLPPQIDQFSSDKSSLVISNARQLKDINSTKAFGLLKIDIDPSLINKALVDAKIGKNGYIIIVDKNGYIVSHKDTSLLGKKIDNSLFTKVNASTDGTFEPKVNNTKMFGVYTTDDRTGWKYIALVPKTELSSTANYIGIFMILTAVFCLIICILISFFTAKQITNPIKSMIQITNELAAGNFAVISKKQKIYELNELSLNFNNMISNLKTTLSSTGNLASDTSNASNNLLNISQTIKLSAEEINGAAEEIAVGSTEQAETAVICVEVSNSFNLELESVISELDTVNKATLDSKEVLNNGKDVINKLKQTSNNNSEAMNNVSYTISNLDSLTKDILNILNKINDITAQTNLLALNASIEAARAGAAGKGFAVVAEEIRKLAEESQGASGEIKKIVEGVNSSIKTSLDISKNAQSAFEKELDQVNTTIQSFGSIETSIINILSSMENVMDTIKLIGNGKDILSKYINNISEISQKNTAATEEVIASLQSQGSVNNNMFALAQSLNSKAAQLEDLINKFKY